ncbi:MAG: DUF2061 domain-containing protein [Raineya sp.]|nr:DUF2061 domain-containing protein [Raineya sp.]MDW8296942.1 DUF2061 domain-containing protein [Raineya sp.]
MRLNRHLAKAISWRITGSVDTFVVGWIFTQHIPTATAISVIEFVSKIFLFYLHEKVWEKISWGKTAGFETHYRSFTKAFSWRIVGTLDTMLISFLLTQKVVWALQIGTVEFFSKIFLYYLHERIWQYFSRKTIKP